MNLSDRRFSYLPLSQQFGSHLVDEMPEPPWSDAVGWSTALRQTADLVEPDGITVAGAGPIYADLQQNAGVDPAEPGFEDALGAASEEFRETIRIIEDVRSEPVVPVVPGPVTICLEQFGGSWLDYLETDEFVALDALHAASQLLTDLVRSFGGTIEGLVVDEPELSDAIDGGLRLEDALLETGAVFNVADHHGLSVLGRSPESLFSSSSSLAESYDVVVFETVSDEKLGSIGDVSIGGAFPETVWDGDNDDFEAGVRDYCENMPEGFVLMPELPAATAPERVRRFRELLDEV